MVGGLADEGEVAAFGILAAEAVAAAGRGQLRRRAGLAARCRDPRMQRVDGFPVGDVEHDADHGWLRAAMQAEHMVMARGAAEIARVVARLDGHQSPYGLVES